MQVDEAVKNGESAIKKKKTFRKKGDADAELDKEVEKVT